MSHTPMTNVSLDALPKELKLRKNCEQADTKTLLGYLTHQAYMLRRITVEVLLTRKEEEILDFAIASCSDKNFKLRRMGALIIGEFTIHSSARYADVVVLLQKLASTDSSLRVRAEAMRASEQIS